MKTLLFLVAATFVSQFALADSVTVDAAGKATVEIYDSPAKDIYKHLKATVVSGSGFSVKSFSSEDKTFSLRCTKTPYHQIFSSYVCEVTTYGIRKSAAQYKSVYGSLSASASKSLMAALGTQDKGANFVELGENEGTYIVCDTDPKQPAPEFCRYKIQKEPEIYYGPENNFGVE